LGDPTEAFCLLIFAFFSKSFVLFVVPYVCGKDRRLDDPAEAFLIVDFSLSFPKALSFLSFPSFVGRIAVWAIRQKPFDC
jgi:hypothetical protein